MSATETQNPAPETTDTVVIDDDSKVADGALTRLKNAAKGLVEAIAEAIPLDQKMSEIYKRGALKKATARSLVLLSDGMPDWTGASATYRSLVGSLESDALAKASAARKSTIENNFRSAMRRGILDGVIVEYVRENTQGLDKVEKGKEKDSPAFRKAMRAQYQRAHDLKMANPIVCPDHWQDTSKDDTSVDAKSEDTAASALSKAVVAVAEMSVVETLDSLHRLFDATLTPTVQPNAKIPGGRDAAAAVLRRIVTQGTAALMILEGKTSGTALDEARGTFEKYRYNDAS
jgi:hypothetical protein